MDNIDYEHKLEEVPDFTMPHKQSPEIDAQGNLQKDGDIQSGPERRWKRLTLRLRASTFHA